MIPNDARPARVTTVFQNEVLTVHLTRNAKAGPEQLKGKVSNAGTIGLSIEESQ